MQHMLNTVHAGIGMRTSWGAATCIRSSAETPRRWHLLASGKRCTPMLSCFQVVAFIKGTRTQPQCGFSFKVLTLLNEARTDYEVVDVLDEQYNPGVREAIKTYSQWPTIPQVTHPASPAFTLPVCHVVPHAACTLSSMAV